MKNNNPQGLDIFSWFFIDPLFAKQSVDGEIQAVNSEYENDISNVDCKQNNIHNKLIINRETVLHGQRNDQPSAPFL